MDEWDRIVVENLKRQDKLKIKGCWLTGEEAAEKYLSDEEFREWCRVHIQGLATELFLKGKRVELP